MTLHAEFVIESWECSWFARVIWWFAAPGRRYPGWRKDGRQKGWPGERLEEGHLIVPGDCTR